jgi:hypothetical protein
MGIISEPERGIIEINLLYVLPTIIYPLLYFIVNIKYFNIKIKWGYTILYVKIDA